MSAKKIRAVLRQDIAGTMAILMESLETHLADSVTTKDANPLWHAECNVDYAKGIYALARVQKYLCELDYKRNYYPQKFNPLKNKQSSGH